MSWSSLAVLAVVVCALAEELLSNPVDTLAPSPPARASPATSLDLSAGHTDLTAEDLEAIAAVATAVKGSLSPVVVAAYVGRSRDADRNMQLAQNYAAEVRKALIKSGLPTLRVIVVSPTFADTTERWRVEVSLVSAVPVFAVKPPDRTWP